MKRKSVVVSEIKIRWTEISDMQANSDTAERVVT
jgi:hypothetical protein